MSQGEEDKDNKQFEASDQRRQQARDDGDVAQSRELNGLFLLVSFLLSVLCFEYLIKDRVYRAARDLLGQSDQLAHDVFEGHGVSIHVVIQNLIIAFAIPVSFMAAGVLASLVLQRAIVFSTKPLVPKFDKISPSENLKKKYGGKGLFDFLKDSLKMTIAGLIAGAFLFVFARDYYNLSAISVEGLYGFTFGQVLWLLAAFTVFQLALSIVDLPLQRLFHARKLRMTRDEVKKEHKESEGDPHFKQARKSRAAKISNGEMLKKVEGATLIMVNPEHYAVALKWDPETDRAPICVGKGVDHLAARIRTVAMSKGIPIRRDPPTARALYRVVEIDQEIGPEFYAAVAAAIQFVGALETRK